MILALVETFTSSRDVNGNCYHFARFWNTEKGRDESVTLEVGGESNGQHLAYKAIGNDWEKVMCFQSVLPKREWSRIRKSFGNVLYEGSPEAKEAISNLYGAHAVISKVANG